MKGGDPMIKESRQCPPAPQPLGIWEIPGGWSYPLNPQKATPGSSVPWKKGALLGQGWK